MKRINCKTWVVLKKASRRIIEPNRNWYKDRLHSPVRHSQCRSKNTEPKKQQNKSKKQTKIFCNYGALDLDYGSSTCGFMDLFLYINQPNSTLPLKGFDINTGSLLRLLRYDHADNSFDQ